VTTVDSVDSAVLLAVLAKVKAGGFTVHAPRVDRRRRKVADGLNDVIIASQGFGAELARVGQVVGKGRCPSGSCSAAGPRAGPGASTRSTA
jgi:hypothetical protein